MYRLTLALAGGWGTAPNSNIWKREGWGYDGILVAGESWASGGDAREGCT